MPMSIARADQALDETLSGVGATPYVWLHTASPGNDGTLNVCQYGSATPVDIVRKSITFSAPQPHATNSERIVLSTNQIEWSSAEIDPSQWVTHISVWSAATGGQVEFIHPVPANTISTGPAGITFQVGALEYGITVFSV